MNIKNHLLGLIRVAGLFIFFVYLLHANVWAQEAKTSSVDALIDSALMPDSTIAVPSPAKTVSNKINREKKDQQGTLYQLNGSVKILKKNARDFVPASEGSAIQIGDMLVTDKNSTCSIALDSTFLNVFYIPESTKAEFRSIEPTDIFLEDGSIYSVLDNLTGKDKVQISTPTAIAAVRGTRFLVEYTASNQDIIVATFDVTGDGKNSIVALQDILPNGGQGKGVDIPEGLQLKLQAGQEPDTSQLKDVDPVWIEKIQSKMEEIEKKREAALANLPETAGEGENPEDFPGDNSFLENSVPKLDPVADLRPDLLNSPEPLSPAPLGIFEEPGEDNPPPPDDQPLDRFYTIFNSETIDEIFGDLHNHFELEIPGEDEIHTIIQTLKESGIQDTMNDPDIHAIYHVDNESVDQDLHQGVEHALEGLTATVEGKLHEKIQQAGIEDQVYQEAAHVFEQTMHENSAQTALEAATAYYEQSNSQNTSPEPQTENQQPPPADS